MKYLSSALLLFGLLSLAATASPKPNIVFILADDMGIGDVSHTTGKAATPNIDRLAEQGMCFTDAHTSSAVCSPTRYGILTGRYNWRSWLKSAVIWTPDKRGPMITQDRLTLPSFLKKNDTPMMPFHSKLSKQYPILK